MTFQVKQPRLQWKFYYQCKPPASSIIFYGIGNAAVVNQSSSFTDGNLEKKEDLDPCACKKFLHFCCNIFHLPDGGFIYIIRKYSGQ
jgi:hypothetical protein